MGIEHLKGGMMIWLWIVPPLVFTAWTTWMDNVTERAPDDAWPRFLGYITVTVTLTFLTWFAVWGIMLSTLGLLKLGAVQW